MAKLHDLGVAEAAKAIRTGDIKAEALADALLARAATATPVPPLDAPGMRSGA